jgi:hypothetical protein
VASTSGSLAAVQETVTDLRSEIPSPHGYSLLGALLVAMVLSASRWTFDWKGAAARFHPETVRVDPVFLPEVEVDGPFRAAEAGLSFLPPSLPWLTLDLLAVTAGAYVGLHLVAVGLRALYNDGKLLPGAPAALTPTWPRLLATVAVVLQANVFTPPQFRDYGARYVFTNVYSVSADVLVSTGVVHSEQYALPGLYHPYLETMVSDPVALVLPYLPALLVTYLGVALTFAGISRALRSRVAQAVGERLWRLPSSVRARLG